MKKFFAKLECPSQLLTVHDWIVQVDEGEELTIPISSVVSKCVYIMFSEYKFCCIYILYIVYLVTACVLIDIKIKLNSLAIGYINRDYCPSPEELLKAWDRSGQWAQKNCCSFHITHTYHYSPLVTLIIIIS